MKKADQAEAMHLDATSHAELLAGTLGRDAASALARHLGAGCEVCEGYLASSERADGIDGRVERALTGLASAPAPGEGAHAADAAAFGRVERRLAAEAGPGERPAVGARGARPARRVRWVPLAAAATVLAAGLAGLLLRGEGPAAPGWDGTKGAGAAQPLATPVRLGFVVVEPGGEGERGAPSLRHGASGDAVPASAALQFEVEVGRATHVTLIRVGPDGAPEPVWEGALAPGATLVEVGGRPAVYPLEGLRGTQRFVALASGAALGPGDLSRALAGSRRVDAEVEVQVE